jgi:hypothetical protein
MKKNEVYFTRRDFLHIAASTAAAAAIGLPIVGCRRDSRPAPEELEKPQIKKIAKVVLVRDKDAVDRHGRLNFDVIGRMLDKAVATLLDKEDAREAWRSLVKPGDIVGIKSNVWSPLPTPKEVERIIKQRVINAGVPKHNIRISDRDAIRKLGKCTALINVRPLRTHHWSGIGGCIKNYIMFTNVPFFYHGDSCANLAAVWKLPIVKGKTRLNILLVLTPLFYGKGPHHFDQRYVWNYKGVMVSFDPVAVDAVGAHLLQVKRRLFFGEDRPITPTKHIRVADKKHKLGVSDLGRIKLIKAGWKEDILI